MSPCATTVGQVGQVKALRAGRVQLTDNALLIPLPQPPTNPLGPIDYILRRENARLARPAHPVQLLRLVQLGEVEARELVLLLEEGARGASVTGELVDFLKLGEEDYFAKSVVERRESVSGRVSSVAEVEVE